jgi:hypothetical protein
MPMPSTARLSRFLLRYTETDTRKTKPKANSRNSSHAVLGHAWHVLRSLSLQHGTTMGVCGQH